MLESLGGVVWHRKVNPFLTIIPAKSVSNVGVAGPVNCDVVFFAENKEERCSALAQLKYLIPKLLTATEKMVSEIKQTVEL